MQNDPMHYQGIEHILTETNSITSGEIFIIKLKKGKMFISPCNLRWVGIKEASHFSNFLSISEKLNLVCFQRHDVIHGEPNDTHIA
jgi:hypothetical protein